MSKFKIGDIVKVTQKKGEGENFTGEVIADWHNTKAGKTEYNILLKNGYTVLLVKESRIKLVKSKSKIKVMNWNEFTKKNMSAYMKKFGGHSKAMVELSKDYKKMKGSETTKKKVKSKTKTKVIAKKKATTKKITAKKTVAKKPAKRKAPVKKAPVKKATGKRNRMSTAQKLSSSSESVKLQGVTELAGKCLREGKSPKIAKSISNKVVNIKAGLSDKPSSKDVAGFMTRVRANKFRMYNNLKSCKRTKEIEKLFEDLSKTFKGKSKAKGLPDTI